MTRLLHGDSDCALGDIGYQRWLRLGCALCGVARASAWSGRGLRRGRERRPGRRSRTRAPPLGLGDAAFGAQGAA